MLTKTHDTADVIRGSGNSGASGRAANPGRTSGLPSSARWSRRSTLRAAFDRHWDRIDHGKADGDNNAYSFGSLGPHNVVLVHMGSMGGRRNRRRMRLQLPR